MQTTNAGPQTARHTEMQPGYHGLDYMQMNPSILPPATNNILAQQQ